MLKSMARKEPASAIAKALKRTEGATRQKATALGVSLNTTRGRAAAKAKPAKAPGAQGRRSQGGAEEDGDEEAGEKSCEEGLIGLRSSLQAAKQRSHPRRHARFSVQSLDTESRMASLRSQ